MLNSPFWVDLIAKFVVRCTLQQHGVAVWQTLTGNLRGNYHESRIYAS